MRALCQTRIFDVLIADPFPTAVSPNHGFIQRCAVSRALVALASSTMAGGILFHGEIIFFALWSLISTRSADLQSCRTRFDPTGGAGSGHPR
jgi:hypothetical protein